MNIADGVNDTVFDSNDVDYIEDILKCKDDSTFLKIFEELDPMINNEFVIKAWNQFNTICQQIILEGPIKAWMACAFYTTVWQLTPPGEEPICKYSVSKLLKICHLNVLEFFEKLNKWAEMIVASRRLLDHINKVQSSLAVSTVVYKKFLPIFRRVFFNSSALQPVPPQNLSSKSFSGIESAQIFELIWLMFTVLKNHFSITESGLINSFHSMLCIVELVYEDLREAKLNHLYNSEFGNIYPALDRVKIFLFEQILFNENYETTALEYLCKNYSGDILDAKHFRSHCLFPKLRKLADDGILIGSADQGGILANIEANKNTLNKIYEESLLKLGNIDERIFIATAVEDMSNIYNKNLDASAINVLQQRSLESELTINTQFFLRIMTRDCLDSLNEARIKQKNRLSVHNYIIKPNLINKKIQFSNENQKWNQRYFVAKIKQANGTNLRMLSSGTASIDRKNCMTSKRFDNVIEHEKCEV